MDEPLWPVTDKKCGDQLLQFARRAFGNNDRISNTFLSISNPVTLTRHALCSTVSRQDYFVAHKADGTRFILCLDCVDDDCVAAMINRAGGVFRTSVLSTKGRFRKGCVFDGELCDVGNGIKHYLVFDVVLLDGVNVSQKPYVQRLELLRTCFATAPRETERPPPTMIDSAHRRCFFWIKPTVAARSLTDLPPPKFPVDGLIFTPAHEGVRTGRNESLFKWKLFNTIDVGFHLLMVDGNLQAQFWFDDDTTGQHTPLGPLFEMDARALRPLCDGFLFARQLCPTLQWSGVFECRCDPGPPHRLRVLHSRTDKSTANTPKTAERTVQTIREDVGWAMIVQACQAETD